MRNVTTPLLVRSELEALLRRPRLRLPGPLEREFRQDYYDRFVTTNRAAFVVGLAVLAGFGVVDRHAAPDSYSTLWLLRFGVGCVAVVALLTLSYMPVYRRIMQPASAFVVVLCGVVITLMELSMNDTEPGYDLYALGIVLVVFFGFAAPRLRFWYAVLAGWAAVLSSWWIGFDHGAWERSADTVHFLVLEAFLIGSCVLGTFAAYALEIGARRSFLQQLLIEQEQERSEALLLNVLPTFVAERLKLGEEVADAYHEVSVLFADIVGFTAMSERLPPTELVALLNEVFSRFDELADRYELEKIKTMGDAYIVVGGIPSPQGDHPGRVAHMALDIQAEARRISVDLGTEIALRIGIDTGPVVAGVIGRRKFSYDLWGDTVNTASRMQSVAEPGQIRVTERARERLERGHFTFEGPSILVVKGKGEMQTYTLTGSTAAHAPSAAERPVRPAAS
jgi:class 3 adenylate cyclase